METSFRGSESGSRLFEENRQVQSRRAGGRRASSITGRGVQNEGEMEGWGVRAEERVSRCLVCR